MPLLGFAIMLPLIAFVLAAGYAVRKNRELNQVWASNVQCRSDAPEALVNTPAGEPTDRDTQQP